MKIIDKYVAKNFLTGYTIAFCVLIGLRVIIDLFVNLDEFAEHAELGTLAIIKNIITFYSLNCTLYFRDFAGMITVVAAAFSLGKMVRSNELVAVMSSGVSLKRVIAPIVILAILLTGLLVIDQELIIPPLRDKLVRSHDDVPGQESYDVMFINDENGALICTQRFDVKTSTMHKPTILVREKTDDSPLWEVSAMIQAENALYDPQTQKWRLTEGRLIEKGRTSATLPVETYASDITPKDIPVRRQAEHKTLLSSRQLTALVAQKTKIKDMAQLYSQRYFRITEPVINMIMLMIALPVLVCRDPKTMKSAILLSFTMTGTCLAANFTCKLMAAESVFGFFIPEFWAWLPVIIFLPLAVMQLDSMKT